MSGTSRWKIQVATVARTTATMDPGTLWVSRGQSSIVATTSAPITRVPPACAAVAPRTATHAESRTPEPPGLDRPTRSGTCWRPMVTAIPTVNPSRTGQGTNRTRRPSPATPITTTITPARTAMAATDRVPSWATIGASTTAMAPVGPDTCTDEPPNTAATTPATMAVTIPAVGPTPDATPNPSASGRATTPTVRPATRSTRQEVRRPA